MDRAKGKIYVVGHHSLQNELLLCHIDNKTGLGCVRIDNVERFSLPKEDKTDFQQLVLIDCLGITPATLFEYVQAFPGSEYTDMIVALLNLQAGTAVESESLELGVRGFFYVNDSVEILIKGIVALFSGEIWVSRNKIFECLMDKKTPKPHQIKLPTVLTKREEEILRLLARGVTNDSIASTLCISPHTVRTHIYNIFKKIKVPNRLQASLWAAAHL